jgi:hygromycin-B 4-O-kinase
VTESLRPDLSFDQVAAFLAEHLDRPVEGLGPLKPGEISRVYAFDGRVIRFSTNADGFEKDQVAHERFAGPGLPIPRVHEIGRFGELWFAISERLPGRIMWDIAPEVYDAALPALLDAHDRIAAIDPGETFSRAWVPGLDAFGADHEQPGFWHGWRRLFDTTFLERDFWDGLHARFRELLPVARDEGRLVHGDFGQNNVLIDGPRVTAVLDWSAMTRGDPLWDLAYIAFSSRRIGSRLRDRYGDLPDYDARMRLYQLRMGLEALRFYARTDQRPAYDWVKVRLAEL